MQVSDFRMQVLLMEIGQALCLWSGAFEFGMLLYTRTGLALVTAQNSHGMPGT